MEKLLRDISKLLDDNFASIVIGNSIMGLELRVLKLSDDDDLRKSIFEGSKLSKGAIIGTENEIGLGEFGADHFKRLADIEIGEGPLTEIKKQGETNG